MRSCFNVSGWSLVDLIVLFLYLKFLLQHTRNPYNVELLYIRIMLSFYIFLKRKFSVQKADNFVVP
jgi:hypothetical protein